MCCTCGLETQRMRPKHSWPRTAFKMIFPSPHSISTLVLLCCSHPGARGPVSARRHSRAPQQNPVNGDIHWLFHANAASGKTNIRAFPESPPVPLCGVIALPFRRVFFCVPVRRKRGAVGVRALSCWWEWDTNVFPLPKPTSLSEA